MEAQVLLSHTQNFDCEGLLLTMYCWPQWNLTMTSGAIHSAVILPERLTKAIVWSALRAFRCSSLACLLRYYLRQQYRDEDHLTVTSSRNINRLSNLLVLLHPHTHTHTYTLDH